MSKDKPMTSVGIDSLPAGSDMDGMIVKTIFHPNKEGSSVWQNAEDWALPYSSDPGEAHKVLRALIEDHEHIKINISYTNGSWSTTLVFGHEKEDSLVVGEASTMALAICRAALKSTLI